MLLRNRPYRPAIRCEGAGARSSANVAFEPGARTAWHTHPLARTLMSPQVVAGPSAKAVSEEIRPGDVVQFTPNERHWHGAAPTTAVTHIAIQEALDGKLSIGWRR